MEFFLLAAIFLTSSGFLVDAAIKPEPAAAVTPVADSSAAAEKAYTVLQPAVSRQQDSVSRVYTATN